MKELGYLVAAYVLTAGAIGAYLLSLARRRRSAERRLEQVEGRPPGHAGEEGRPPGRVSDGAPRGPRLGRQSSPPSGGVA